MTVQNIRPMKGPTDPIDPAKDLVKQKGPWWVSPKLDGIRSINIDGQQRSNTLKPHPNKYMNSRLSDPRLHGLDGELVVGSPTAHDCINRTTSGINSIEGEPDFCYYVFDVWHTARVGFRQRYGYLKRRALTLKREGFPIEILPQILCHTIEQVVAVCEDNYDAGYEGSIVRSFDDFYKYGRTTVREGYMFKVKEHEDFEVHITGFIEMQHNENEAKLDERGLTKRSSHKANKVAAGTLGKMTGIRVDTGEPVTVGRGKMTAAEALEVWQNQEKYAGCFAKCRGGKHGVKDKPRFPRFIVWRDPMDM